MNRSAMQLGIRRLRQQLAVSHAADDSDEQLLQAFLHSRDEAAFAVMVRRHGPMVLHVCRRVLGHQQDAEDAFQATFLVLARNAASLHNKTALASWLHGTAYRIAMKAKQSAARRRKYEGQTPTRSSVDPLEELRWREVRALLDDEIVRLPETYRSVFVFCCLENLSQAEAGKRLSLKERTVSNRLAAARQRLSQRLARRGVELTALLGAASLATPSASALPAGLMASTLQAVLATAAGEGLAGVVSASVAELVKSASVAMMMSKAKIATVLLLAMGMLAGASVWAYRGVAVNALPSSTQPVEPLGSKRNENKAASPKPEAAKTVKIKGRVLDPEGKPKAGARLLLLGSVDQSEQQELLLESGKVRQLGVSSADGCFTVAVPKETTKRWGDSYLLVQADDSGMDFLELYRFRPGKPVELHLVKDNIIRGRVVNTEGKPVAGVRVAVNHFGIYPNNSLDSFLVFWKNRPFNFGTRGGKNLYAGTGALLAATTDAGGRFVLHGVGEERFVSLRLSGGGIAAEEVWVVNRAGFDPKPYNQATLDNTPKGQRGFNGRWMLSGPDVSVVAESEKIIRGMVTESDTGKGRPGVVVRLTRKNGGDQSGGGDYINLRVAAKTDAQGRYEIHGARKAKSYLVEVESDAKTGYLGRGIWVEDTPGYRPVTADIRVRKGVIVTGRIIDKATGKPLNGFVMISQLFDNPFEKEYSDGSPYSGLIWAVASWGTDGNGVFRAVTIPGPVLLMGAPERREMFKSHIPDPKYPQYFNKREGYYSYRGSGTTIVQGIFCKVLQIKSGVAEVKQDIELERRNVLGVVRIRDAEGRPLTEADAWGAANSIEGDSCTVYGDEQPRLLVFYEAKRKLAGVLTLKTGEKLPQVVKLKPLGSVQGRLLDGDGKPLEGIVVAPHYRERSANSIDSSIHEARPIESDANGAFTLDSLIPELSFELTFRRGRRNFERETKSAGTAIQVKPGECRDLGAIHLKSISPKADE